MGGAEGQDRTGDTAIFSRVLYRLSYLGASSLSRSRQRPRILKHRSVQTGELRQPLLVDRRLAGERTEPIDAVDYRRVSGHQA